MILAGMISVYWSLWKEGDNMKREAILGWKYTFGIGKSSRIAVEPLLKSNV